MNAKFPILVEYTDSNTKAIITSEAGIVPGRTFRILKENFNPKPFRHTLSVMLLFFLVLVGVKVLGVL